MNNSVVYRKIPIVSPGLIFVQKAVLLGLFSGELSVGLVIGRNFAFQNGFGLSIKTASSNSPWAYIRKGLLSRSEGYLGLRFGGGGGGLLSEFCPHGFLLMDKIRATQNQERIKRSLHLPYKPYESTFARIFLFLERRGVPAFARTA